MTKRIPQVNQLIKEEVSKIIFKEADLPEDVLVTCTRVDASPNLTQAKVYISCLVEEKTDRIIEILNNQIYELQQMLNKRLEMRPVPKIAFVKETETVGAGRIEEILEDIKKEKD